MTDIRVVLLGALVLWALRPETRVRAVDGGPVDVRQRRLSARAAAALALTAGAVLVATVAPIVALVLVVGVGLRWARRRVRAERLRQLAVERSLPDAIDLLALVVSAGVPIRRALGMVAPRCPSPHREAWATVLARTDAGEAFTDALGNVAETLGPPVRPLVTALIAADRDGVALGPALDRCSAEAHRRRRVRAEEAARRVPVLMLFPLVCCVLPAFGLLTVVPLLAGSVSDLQLPA